ncbi:hypothetical protein ANCCAN_22176 [Ancylostoma caninum]|uniref:SCP domain-containing protein n=1 Tax=Ancylostoma caninum TaxID=29170 RepID=A0A368FIN7_ANCCA|nr:hypothetical protein ANCCAN_22176 [Ancylostoma caninum]
MRHLAILAVAVIGNIIATTDYQCWNFAQTNEIRHIYLSEINKLRQPIGNGTAEGLPQGKNIYKLFWDCILENYAQKAVDECSANPSIPNDLSYVFSK